MAALEEVGRNGSEDNLGAGGKPRLCQPTEGACRVTGVMTQLGADHTDIAAALGVDVSRLRDWQKAHPQFAAALDAADDPGAAALERVLVMQALGYNRKREKLFFRRGEIVRAEISEYVPPDVKSAHIWLLSRMPHLYLYREGAIEEDAGAESSDFIEYVNQQKAAERLEKSGKPDREFEEMSCGVAKAIARLGGSDLLIAEALGVATSTLDDLRRTRSEFAHALQAGRDEIGRAIERALLRRAVGFSYPVDKVFCTRDGNLVRGRTTKELTPSKDAAEIWLRAHRPEFCRPLRREQPPGFKAQSIDAVGWMKKHLHEQAMAERQERARLREQNYPETDGN